jgi:hypothetical protein
VNKNTAVVTISAALTVAAAIAVAAVFLNVNCCGC